MAFFIYLLLTVLAHQVYVHAFGFSGFESLVLALLSIMAFMLFNVLNIVVHSHLADPKPPKSPTDDQPRP